MTTPPGGAQAYPAPFIVGAPRSGTTLVRLMLDAHPALSIPPETGFLLAAGSWRDATDPRAAFADAVTGFPPGATAWADFGLDARALVAALERVDPFDTAGGLRAFYGLYAARFGKPRWGDKTPIYCLHVAEVLATLPEARIVHVVRDGRDVACSMRGRWFAPGNTIEERASFWCDCVTSARRACAGDPRALEVRFEDLVREPVRELTRICALVDLPYDPAMVRYHLRAHERLAEHRERRRTNGTVVVTHEARLEQQALTMRPPEPARAGAWRGEMSPDEQRRFDRVAGDLLAELGYDR